MKNRLKTAFNITPGQDYRVVGEPTDVGGARALAEQDRYQFEFWAMSLLEAFPREQSKKKGADLGIDGVVYFIDGPRRTVNKAVVQVKSGRVSSPLIRDLVGTVEREKAAMGLFITLEEPTSAMTHGGGQRRVLPLRPVADGLPQDPDTHRRGSAGGQGFRDTAQSADVPAGAARPARPWRAREA